MPASDCSSTSRAPPKQHDALGRVPPSAFIDTAVAEAEHLRVRKSMAMVDRSLSGVLLSLRIAVLLVWFISPVVPRATPLCVNLSGTGGCYSSIQAAVNAAGRSEVIDVAGGTYSEMVSLPSGSRVTIQGEDIDSTIGANGGDGIYASPCYLQVLRSPETGNSGNLGGILSACGRLLLADSTISGNTREGLTILAPTRVRIERSTIANNSNFGI